VNQKPTRRYELKPIPSQPKKNKIKLSEKIRINIKKVNIDK